MSTNKKLQKSSRTGAHNICKLEVVVSTNKKLQKPSRTGFVCTPNEIRSQKVRWSEHMSMSEQNAQTKIVIQWSRESNGAENLHFIHGASKTDMQYSRSVDNV